MELSLGFDMAETGVTPHVSPRALHGRSGPVAWLGPPTGRQGRGADTRCKASQPYDQIDAG